jgi:hypothetical protein
MGAVVTISAGSELQKVTMPPVTAFNSVSSS